MDETFPHVTQNTMEKIIQTTPLLSNIFEMLDLVNGDCLKSLHSIFEQILSLAYIYLFQNIFIFIDFDGDCFHYFRQRRR